MHRTILLLTALALSCVTADVAQAATINLNASFSCVINEAGEGTLFQTKGGTTAELQFSKAKKNAKRKAAAAAAQLKSAKASSAGKKKIQKLTEKSKAAKKFSANIKKCESGTLTEEDVTPPPTGNTSTVRSRIVLQRNTQKEPSGITCELSTGTAPKLSADFGSAEFTSDRVVGLLGCKTNDGSAFDADEDFIDRTKANISGFLFTIPAGNTGGASGFNRRDVEKTANVFVQRFCENASTCRNFDRIHADHKSGSAAGLLLHFSLRRDTQTIEFVGEFGGKGRAF